MRLEAQSDISCVFDDPYLVSGFLLRININYIDACPLESISLTLPRGAKAYGKTSDYADVSHFSPRQ